MIDATYYRFWNDKFVWVAVLGVIAIIELTAIHMEGINQMKIVKVIFKLSDDMRTNEFVEYLRTKCEMSQDATFDPADPTANRAEVVDYDEEGTISCDVCGKSVAADDIHVIPDERTVCPECSDEWNRDPAAFAAKDKEAFDRGQG